MAPASPAGVAMTKGRGAPESLARPSLPWARAHGEDALDGSGPIPC